MFLQSYKEIISIVERPYGSKMIIFKSKLNFRMSSSNNRFNADIAAEGTRNVEVGPVSSTKLLLGGVDQSEQGAQQSNSKFYFRDFRCSR